MLEKFEICKMIEENENFKDIIYMVNSKEHNMDILLRLMQELKKDYPELQEDQIYVCKSKFTKDVMGVKYVFYKNKKRSGCYLGTASERIHKMYKVEGDLVWFEYFITIDGSLNYADHLMTLADEIHKDFPNVENKNIQIKRALCKVPIPRDFYLRFAVPKKDVNLNKLGKNVVSEDYIFYRINSTL